MCYFVQMTHLIQEDTWKQEFSELLSALFRVREATFMLPTARWGKKTHV